MNISISNIAWEPDDNEEIARVLQNHRVNAIEVALTKIHPSKEFSESILKEYRTYWESKGVRIVALQSLLFGHPALSIFGTTEIQNKTKDQLKRVMHSASLLGATVLVFGSPHNRKRNTLSFEQAVQNASEFFSEVGDIAQSYGVTLAIEPNPPQYGCDFLTNTQEVLAFVQKVNHPHIKLNLDSGILYMNDENISKEIRASARELVHFHVSEPQLAPIGTDDVPHTEIAQVLRDIHYAGFVSIEMKCPENPNRIKTITQALEFVRHTYHYD